MRYHLSRLTCPGLVLVLALIVSSCSASGNSAASSSTPAPSAGVISTSPTGPIKVKALSPTIDTLTQQVLANMHLHAWNPAAMSHSLVTGGLFINWNMSDPSKTNDVRPGPDGNPQHNHDPQVDLLYLTALAEYHQIHPEDPAYNSDLSRATSLVLADFHSYDLPKGWVYFYLLRDGLLLHNDALITAAHAAAYNFYTRWYDPALGTVYNRNHSAQDYSTNHTLQCGAALIDAGLRWHEADWVEAGKKTVDHTISSSISPQYHLFYNSMFAGNTGQDRVQNYQAKPSTQGESVDALVTAYTLTGDQQYLNKARQVLQSVFSSSGLWDTTRGGLFFALDMDKGKVLTSYKETRSQTLMLNGLNRYNQAAQQAGQEPMTTEEQQLIHAITDNFYEHTYHGFFYRMTTDFQVFVSAPGQGIGKEDYFTTEALGSALDSLQQTELQIS